MTTDSFSEPNTPDTSEPDRATKGQHHAWWFVVIPVVILALGVYLFQSKRIPAAELGTKPKLHSDCESYFPMPGEVQITTDDDYGITTAIEYNIERMSMELDYDKYRRKDDRSLKESTVVSYDKLRGPERHYMNRVASCLNSANISLKNAMEKE